MRPWTNDAKDIGEIYEDDLVITPSIREFIHPDDRDRIFYVVAPKGIGKSLLLIYKRQLYDAKYIKTDSDKKPKKDELYLIPKDLPVDRCLDITRSTLTTEKIELLSDHSKCKQLWKFCISLSVIKNIIKFHKPKYLEDLKNCLDESLTELNVSRDLSALIWGQTTITPSDVFVSILKFNYNDIIKTINMQSQFSELIRNNIRSGVAIFIDNVDQSFDDYLRSKEGHPEASKSIWYTTQIGLILAVYELSAINGHIKVFVSVRKEAFQKMRTIGSLGSQIRGEALDIAYTANQLKEIFIKNIQIMDKRDLVIPEDNERDPIHAFLGLNNNKIGSILGKVEDIFCYIHRHSLKRPRDLMTIGRSITQIDVIERTPENIKSAVNTSANEIVTDFLSEIQPFANMVDFDRLFGLIHSNVLRRSEIIDICGKYNQKRDCHDEDCDKCEMTNVFCELYKFGLLGIVIRDLINKDKFWQKFVHVGDVDYEEKVLPNSHYYLTHPALISKIEESNLRQRNEFNPVSTIIIGDGYGWRDPFENSKVTVSAIIEYKDKKKLYRDCFRSELYGISASRIQKERLNGQSEVDSKTLETLKNKLLDLVSSCEEIRWLDVGCGDGRCLEVLDAVNKRNGIYYHGIDVEYNLDIASKKAKTYGIKSDFDKIDAESLNFESKYDLITAILLFHEVDPLTLPDILRNLIKALKCEGELIISDFQEPYEFEKDVVIWSYDDINVILNNLCEKVNAIFSTIPSKEHPNEFSFYYGCIKKTPFHKSSFEEFLKNYDNFLTTKKDKLIMERASLRDQMKMRANQILDKKIDSGVPTDEEFERIENNIGEDYIIKGYKAHLLTRQIEFLDTKLKEFLEGEKYRIEYAENLSSIADLCRISSG
jgi:2-polyprenyl-3-methyl-5-hydroxy-6-metoxy-1,4-benzoquinol methylase